MALVIALALMTGLQEELRDRILGSTAAHLRLEDRTASTTTAPKSAKLRTVPHVIGAAPAILGKGLLTAPATTRRSSAQGHRPGARADGDRHRRRDAERQPRRRSSRRATTSRAGILLGSDLADEARRRASATRCTLLTPRGHAVADGHDAAHAPARAWPASSASASTSSTRRTAFVSLDVAERLLDKDSVDFIQLRVDDIYARAGDRRSRSRRARRRVPGRRTGPT